MKKILILIAILLAMICSGIGYMIYDKIQSERIVNNQRILDKYTMELARADPESPRGLYFKKIIKYFEQLPENVDYAIAEKKVKSNFDVWNDLQEKEILLRRKAANNTATLNEKMENTAYNEINYIIEQLPIDSVDLTKFRDEFMVGILVFLRENSKLGDKIINNESKAEIKALMDHKKTYLPIAEKICEKYGVDKSKLEKSPLSRYCE